MRYVHTMVRVTNLDESVDFWSNKIGLIETRRIDHDLGRFTLVFLAAPQDLTHAKEHRAPELELTYNWDGEATPLETGRSWGHLAYRVDNIYTYCQSLIDKGVTLNRPPRDGHMAFVKSPDGVSIEIIQETAPLEVCEPWASMENIGKW